MSPGRTSVFWRRRRDSNPRDPFESNGFQDRRFQPLTHSSVFNSSVFCELAANLLHSLLLLLHFGAGCSRFVAAPASLRTAATFAARLEWVSRSLNLGLIYPNKNLSQE